MTTTKPVYCREGRTANSWERNPSEDIRGAETNKIMWEAYICEVCGEKTICPKELRDERDKV